jgi:hypothetical protein
MGNFMCGGAHASASASNGFSFFESLTHNYAPQSKASVAHSQKKRGNVVLAYNIRSLKEINLFKACSQQLKG